MFSEIYKIIQRWPIISSSTLLRNTTKILSEVSTQVLNLIPGVHYIVSVYNVFESRSRNVLASPSSCCSHVKIIVPELHLKMFLNNCISYSLVLIHSTCPSTTTVSMKQNHITLLRAHMCVLWKNQGFIANLCRTHFQDNLFISDYVSVFSIMSSHFSEVPLKNRPFPLLTIFVEAVVKFVNWGHFKVLMWLYSRYSMPCGTTSGREQSSFCKKIIQRRQNFPLPSIIVKDYRNLLKLNRQSMN